MHRLRERGADRLRFETDVQARTLRLDAPEDLTARYDYLPREVLPESRRFVLTTDRQRMSEAISESRRSEGTWPSLHYLWRLSPVVGWLNDRVLAAFGRFEAPVLAGVPGLANDETIFVFSGLVPNRKSHPLIYEWIGIGFRDGVPSGPMPFEALVERTGLGRQPIANRQDSVDVNALANLLPEAVARAREHFVARRRSFEDRVNAELEKEVGALDAFRERQLRQFQLEFSESGGTETLRRGRQDRVRHEIDAVHDEYLTWIEDTMTTEPAPWIKTICVMTSVQ